MTKRKRGLLGAAGKGAPPPPPGEASTGDAGLPPAEAIYAPTPVPAEPTYSLSPDSVSPDSVSPDSFSPDSPSLDLRSPEGLESSDDDSWLVDESSDPPTDDVISAGLEDFAGLYRAPVGNLEPPPVPGLVDRFTPAPQQPRSAVPMDAPDPSYLEPATAPKEWVSMDPTDEVPYPPVGDDQDGEEAPPFWRQASFVIPAAIAGVITVGTAIFLFVALVGVGVLELTRPGTPPVAYGVAGVSRPDIEVLSAVAEAEPVVVQDTSSVPSASKPKATRQRQAASTQNGKIQVRTTRSTLVYVNGQPVGRAPVNIERPPGVYTIHIVDQGKRVEQRVDLDAGAVRSVEF
jgi:hypothetical protein